MRANGCALNRQEAIMSISPYQYQLLTQSFSSLQPNFHSFFVSLQSRLKCYNLQLATPDSPQHIRTIEHGVHTFLKEATALLPQQDALVDFIIQSKKHLHHLGLCEPDISVLAQSILETIQVHLGRQFTLALRNAWRKALHMFANIIRSVVFQANNVVNLQHFRQQKHQQTSTLR